MVLKTVNVKDDGHVNGNVLNCLLDLAEWRQASK